MNIFASHIQTKFELYISSSEHWNEHFVESLFLCFSVCVPNMYMCLSSQGKSVWSPLAIDIGGFHSPKIGDVYQIGILWKSS